MSIVMYQKVCRLATFLFFYYFTTGNIQYYSETKGLYCDNFNIKAKVSEETSVFMYFLNHNFLVMVWQVEIKVNPLWVAIVAILKSKQCIN